MSDIIRPEAPGSREASARDRDPAALRRQALIGLGLASAILGGFVLVHGVAVFGLDIATTPTPLVIAIIALQTWLSVGLFIVAHDAMHGSLAPFRPGINRWVGRIALMLYAGFDYDSLIARHFAHHRHAGLAGDPDFDEDHPRAFWPWFLTFFRRYVTLRQLAILAGLSWFWVLVFGAPVTNMLLFWALPSLLAAVQLFYFGTYRPHRHGDEPFADQHRARSETMPSWLSLLTCFHFGYHHEHHDKPHVPWWRLPAERRKAS
jgi:beta-carotene ketolase (CrtW type)